MAYYSPYGVPGGVPMGPPQPPAPNPFTQPGYGQPAYGQGSYGPPGYAQPAVDPNVYQWFQAVDTNRSGHICQVELQQALTNANWTRFNAETCRLMIAMFDRDRSGQIDLNEFQSLWTYIHQWKTIFDTFDRDRSGSIDAGELCNAFNQMGYRISHPFAQTIVYRYDSTRCNRLSLDNFIQACIVLKSASDSFRQKDYQQSGVIQIGYEEFLNAVVINKI